MFCPAPPGYNGRWSGEAAQFVIGQRRIKLLLQLRSAVLGQPVTLVKSPYLIGSHPKSDLRVELAGVNRRHALIVRQLADWVIFDLRSSYGMQVNDAQGRLLGSPQLLV